MRQPHAGESAQPCCEGTEKYDPGLEERNAFGRQRLPTAQGRQRIEIASAGIDEEVALVGSDPYGGLSSVGLRVPFLASTQGDTRSRYLFMLSTFTVPEGRRARLIGFRQLLTIGAVQNPTSTPRIIEKEVVSPFFKFTNGNVSWHLRQMALTEPFQPLRPGLTRFMAVVTPPAPLVPLQNLAWKMSDTPALLFQSVTTPNLDPFYVDLTAYQAPNAGRPWGRDLAGLGNFHDLRTKWRDGNGWTSLNETIEGPARVAFFASVFQTNAGARPTVAASLTDPSGSSLGPEEDFIFNYPEAIYRRVGGSLIVEFDGDDL